MIELRWRKAFEWGDVPAVSMSNDKGEGGNFVLQYREWLAGTVPGLIEPNWLDVPIMAPDIPPPS